ncbi:MAG: NADH dehydrogenase [Bdellovibrionales bacterium GWA2_49_15]|nr:MAG: NADH dehydrogenase [Bdellovibrionales bacterium GWA2_49_15]HAZ12171.1 NADH-quinone oxidoreductase subunit B [Bdellovibrionales bacterium]
MSKDGSAMIFPSLMSEAIKWARKNSLWPMPYGTSCCGIELMSTLSSTYDLSRFGAEVVRFSPRQADMLIVAGTITTKMAPVLRSIYDQILEPKWVIAMGACSSSGGIFDTYSVLQGIDEIIPVDVYVPGCPPIPEGLIHSILHLQKVIDKSLERRPAVRPSPEDALNAMTYSQCTHAALVKSAYIVTKDGVAQNVSEDDSKKP